MEKIWFVVIALMLATYVVLDGFDLGVGAIYKAFASGELKLFIDGVPQADD